MTAPNPLIRTDRELFAYVRGLGLSIRKDACGEYRITHRCPHNTAAERQRAEFDAYYTNDRADAAATARNFFRGYRGPVASCDLTVTPAAQTVIDGIAAGLAELHAAHDADAAAEAQEAALSAAAVAVLAAGQPVNDDTMAAALRAVARPTYPTANGSRCWYCHGLTGTDGVCTACQLPAQVQR